MKSGKDRVSGPAAKGSLVVLEESVPCDRQGGCLPYMESSRRRWGVKAEQTTQRPAGCPWSMPQHWQLLSV